MLSSLEGIAVDEMLLLRSKDSDNQQPLELLQLKSVDHTARMAESEAQVNAEQQKPAPLQTIAATAGNTVQQPVRRRNNVSLQYSYSYITTAIALWIE